MGERASVKHVRKILIFLYLFVQLLGAEGQLFESLFSKRSSQDGEQNGFVEDTSKHFLSMLFTPFNNNNQQYEGGGGTFTSFLSPSRSGPANYGNYRNSASQKPSTNSYGNYNQGYAKSNSDYYTCEGCGGNESPPPPSRQISSGGGTDYACAGCDKYPTQPRPPPAVIDYSCKGCNNNAQRSSRLQEYYPASTTYNEHYQSPKVYHEAIGFHKKPKYSVIDTRLRIPPVKFRFHINPKITITTNTQDPLAKPHHHDVEDDDYIPPPELHPHPHHSFGHGYHHHTSRQSHDHHHHHHHEEPYGAQITKHEQPIRNKYERSFAIKLNPEIFTDPPPTRPTTTPRPATTSRSRTSSQQEISPRLQSASPTQRTTRTTTTTTTTTSSPASSDTRASLDGLREAAESGLSPLEVLLARRRTSTTTTTTEASTTAAPTTTRRSTAETKTTPQQREVEEITVKSTVATEAASSNEIEAQNNIATTLTVVEKIVEATTQDPKATLAKLREAADAGLSPFEVLLSRSRSNTERKLSPRKAESN